MRGDGDGLARRRCRRARSPAHGRRARRTARIATGNAEFRATRGRRSARSATCSADGAHRKLALVDPLAHAGEDEAHGGHLDGADVRHRRRGAGEAGRQVAKGAPLLILEAMKMEHTITAPADGTVTAVNYRAGDQVKEGADLVDIDDDGLARRMRILLQTPGRRRRRVARGARGGAAGGGDRRVAGGIRRAGLRARLAAAAPSSSHAWARRRRFSISAPASTRSSAMPTLPRDVPVIRLEDAGMAEQMAEYVTLAVLRAYREIDAYAEQQRDGRWEPRPRLAKAGFGVGILGFGVLGQAVATALAPFGFPLACWSRTRKTLHGRRVFAGTDELPAFLALASVLVCLLPPTPETDGLLDRPRCRNCRAARTWSTSRAAASSSMRI